MDDVPRLNDDDKIGRYSMLQLLDNAAQEPSLQSEKQKHSFPDLEKKGKLPLEQVLENN